MLFRFAQFRYRNYSENAGWSSLVARQAHNLKAAGSNPPQPIPAGCWKLIAFTSFEIAKEGCTLGWLTMFRAGLNNIIPVNHVGQRDGAPGQLSGKVRSYR